MRLGLRVTASPSSSTSHHPQPWRLLLAGLVGHSAGCWQLRAAVVLVGGSGRCGSDAVDAANNNLLLRLA